MKVTYSKVDGRTYAYACTSRRIPGRKNPVSEKRYLGVVDEGVVRRNGEVINPELQLCEGASVRSLGDVLIVLSLMHRFRYPRFFREIAGDEWLRVMTITIAQTIRPSSIDSVSDTLRTRDICRTLGLEELTSRRAIGHAIDSIDMLRAQEYLIETLRDYDGELLVHCTDVFFPDTFTAQISESDWIDHTLSTLVAIQRVGDMPTIFTSLNTKMDGRSGPDALYNLLEDVKHRYTVVMNIQNGKHIDLREMKRLGMRFVIPMQLPQWTYEQDLSCYPRIVQGGNMPLIDMGMFVFENGCSGQTIRPMTEDDEGFATVSVYLTDNSELNKVLSESVRSNIRWARSQLNGSKIPDPDSYIENMTGSLSRFLRCRIEDDGSVRVSVKQKNLSRFCSNLGRILLISDGVNSSTVSNACENGHRLDVALQQYFGNPMNITRYIGKSTGAKGSLLLESLAISIYIEIQKIIDDNDLDMSIGDVLHMASSYCSIETPFGTFRSTMGKEVRELFRVFGVDPDASLEDLSQSQRPGSEPQVEDPLDHPADIVRRPVGILAGHDPSDPSLDHVPGVVREDYVPLRGGGHGDVVGRCPPALVHRPEVGGDDPPPGIPRLVDRKLDHVHQKGRLRRKTHVSVER